MKIDRKLNIVFTVEPDEGGSEMYVHSTPISEEVFDIYYMVICEAFARIYTMASGPVGGPRIAAKVLRDVAKAQGVWEGPAGVETGLMNEIRRLTNIITPTPDRGWVTVPFQEAIDKKILTPRDVADLEGAIAFFICTSAMCPRKELASVLGMMQKLWNVQLVSSNCTEYARSLPTLTVVENSGVRVGGSSVPA
jgi:hypothetical protein